ncbi:MAG: hypothetical protein MJ184_09655 [Treponema sp.]|uniref:hypothetical protein n=1 Tax=Treponema sp. TaxID=166 RepID=UPI00298E4F60|nr:hypothetical protein [Treponema sp.]MCQ2601610.1 hypothetical protein [Treponema sp.]
MTIKLDVDNTELANFLFDIRKWEDSQFKPSSFLFLEKTYEVMKKTLDIEEEEISINRQIFEEHQKEYEEKRKEVINGKNKLDFA